MMRTIRLYLTMALAGIICACVQQPAEFEPSPLPIPSREEISANDDWLSGHRMAYPDSEYAVTAPPRGYRPFYISHLGRHGSRFVTQEPVYLRLERQFRAADSLGMLTELGRSALPDVLQLCEDARGRSGELTHVGEQEHRHIAERMYRHYPEVFRGRGRVDVQTSARVRSIMSGVFAAERLKELNPRLDVSRSSHPGNWQEIFCLDNIHELSRILKGEGELRSDEVKARMIPGDRLVKSLFTESPFIPEDRRWLFAEDLHTVATDAKGAGRGDIDLMKLFTRDELFTMWEHNNACFYYMHVKSARFGTKAQQDAVKVCERIVAEADEAIAGEGIAANLRYGHDNNVLVLASLLGIGVSNEPETDYHDIRNHFCDFLIVPFAGNVQMVFFRKGDDVLVKFLLNEQEIVPTGLTPVWGPFCRWEDVRKFIIDRIC